MDNWIYIHCEDKPANVERLPQAAFDLYKIEPSDEHKKILFDILDEVEDFFDDEFCLATVSRVRLKSTRYKIMVQDIINEQAHYGIESP